jgi:membrane protein implicated in regulation of membrane protease activity
MTQVIGTSGGGAVVVCMACGQALVAIQILTIVLAVVVVIDVYYMWRRCNERRRKARIRKEIRDGRHAGTRLTD